ncbi:hypothetical protein UVI_02001980 [Ustilaginoidea virens]|uniref:Uncharacterized protein n=1 Tax=Ustilaginoidea virens TaxID=1159556 RepID=A0A1B5L2J4_USTVR|nr:hypothetical protein UVI_02001980 [Ustilaginoidea virens]
MSISLWAAPRKQAETTSAQAQEPKTPAWNKPDEDALQPDQADQADQADQTPSRTYGGDFPWTNLVSPKCEQGA